MTFSSCSTNDDDDDDTVRAHPVVQIGTENTYRDRAKHTSSRTHKNDTNMISSEPPHGAQSWVLTLVGRSSSAPSHAFCLYATNILYT